MSVLLSTRSVRVIDTHSHLAPPRPGGERSPYTTPWDADRLIEEQQRSGVDVTLFGNPWFGDLHDRDPLSVMRPYNEFAVDIGS